MDETRFPHFTRADFAALPHMNVELRNGDLYIGGRNYGHGAWARAVLAPLLSDEDAAPAPVMPELWASLPETTFEYIGGLHVGGRNYVRGWHAYALLFLLAHPPEEP